MYNYSCSNISLYPSPLPDTDSVVVSEVGSAFCFFLLHFTQSIHCSGCIVLSCRHTASPPDILRHERAWHQAGDLSVPVGRTHACPKHLGAEPHSLLLSHRQLLAVLSQGEKRTEKPRSPSSETQTLLFSSWQFLSGISMHHAQRCS